MMSIEVIKQKIKETLKHQNAIYNDDFLEILPKKLSSDEIIEIIKFLKEQYESKKDCHINNRNSVYIGMCGAYNNCLEFMSKISTENQKAIECLEDVIGHIKRKEFPCYEAGSTCCYSGELIGHIDQKIRELKGE